jgi:hypothetical protein
LEGGVVRLKFLRLAASVAAVTVLTVGCAGTSTGPSPSVDPDPTLEPELPAALVEAIALRTDLGLRADTEYVDAVHAANDSIRHDMGLLVTPEEANALDRRFAAQGELDGLIAYGAEHPDSFGGMYIDQASGGDVVLLFTRDVERHARVAAALAPAGITVRVRRVDFTEAELTEFLEDLDLRSLGGRGVDMLSAGLDTIRNVVTLEVKTNDQGFEERLEAAHGGRLDVIVHPAPGPWENVADGDGWRLIAVGETGGDEAYTVRAATDAGTWSAMWQAIGPRADQPAVDLEAEVVVTFGHGIGSSCREVRLDGVVIEDGEVYSVTSDPLAPRNCTADLAGTAVFVVAVSREALPIDGFTLRLGEQRATCGDCGFSEQIEVPLP